MSAQRQAGRAAAARAEAHNDDDVGRPPARLGRFLRVFDAARRPDRTWEGFRAAAKTAISIAEQIGWISADDMCERIEHEMAWRLRLKDQNRDDVYTGLHIHFVGCDRKTRTPQYRIASDWGWRIDVAGLISFELHKPLAR